ncbi:MAG: peptidylprolyl isomerase [Lunatimonas sp.]|uniref:peptidylprolyl isomerase n=1 Tax=Lunatimonas sp. TaxID=2060141 RepID=UPI00263B5C1A|nr:peptidylprolyl isomerase [Lunatimonas sp.]MCC5937754.1 peptidylprolyl isomerase [Lunatimonas sp.]
MKFGFSICFALVLLSACATKVAVEENNEPVVEVRKYLFTIDGEPTYADEFLYILNKNNQPGADRAVLSEEDFEKNLELFINFKLKVAEAMKLGYHETEEFEREFAAFREDLRKPYLLESEVQEGELQKAYERLQEVVKASHILLSFPTNASLEDSIAVLRMAEKIQSEAQAGADFGALALEHSQDPSAQVNRGNLGYFTAMQMVYPFEAAAYDLQVGEVSQPVLTDFGYHIIRLEDRKPNPGEIRVSHLLVRTNPADPASEDRAVRRIADIYAQLRLESSTWEGTVASFSEDQGTRNSGGLLPWFGVGSIVPEFEEAAFNLTEIGEISPPVKTDYGYHIIRLEERKPIAPFEELEPTLKSRILRDSRSTLIKSQVLAMQKAKYQVKENEPLLLTLENVLSDWSGDSADALETVLNAEGLWEEELVVIAGEPMPLRTFHAFVQKELNAVESRRVAGWEGWYERFLADRLKAAEEQELLETNADYRLLLQEFREGILLFSLMNDLVWQKGILDSLGQHQYYEANIDRYQWKDRVPALVVTMTQENETQESNIRRFLSSKRYHADLKYQLEDRWLDEFPLLFTLEDKLVEVPEHPVIKALDLSKPFHDIRQEGKQYFVLTGERVPAEAKKFEETRGMVIQDYQSYLDEKLIGELRNKFVLRLDEDEKKRVYEIAVN